MDELVEIIEKLEARIALLERLVELKNITVPTDGKFVVDSQTADPPIENGRIYYNTTSNKLRGCEGGAYADLI